MDTVYKSKVDKWYIWTCIGLTVAFIGSIFLCYDSSLVLLIDVVFSGVCLGCLFDILLHTDYTIKDVVYPMRDIVSYGFADKQDNRNIP